MVLFALQTILLLLLFVFFKAFHKKKNTQSQLLKKTSAYA